MAGLIGLDVNSDFNFKYKGNEETLFGLRS